MIRTSRSMMRGGRLVLAFFVVAACGGGGGGGPKDQAVTTPEDTALDIEVSGLGTEDVLGQPEHGVTVRTKDLITYTPATNYNGADSFTAGDATISITVTPVNDPPSPSDDVFTSAQDVTTLLPFAALLGNDSDVDGDTLTISAVSAASHGTATLGAEGIEFVPEPGFVGDASFMVDVSDGATSISSMAVITFTAVVCGDGVVEGNEDCEGDSPTGGCLASCKLACGSGTGPDKVTIDPLTGHCYAAYDGANGTFADAAADCASKGGHLPALTTAAENDVLQLVSVGAADPWLGLRDSEGFAWTSGEPFDFFNWAPNQPDLTGSCGRFTALDGRWHDEDCASQSSGIVCEFDLLRDRGVSAGTGGTGEVMADLDGDGQLDIATVDHDGAKVTIYLNDGTGIILPGTTMSVPAPQAEYIDSLQANPTTDDFVDLVVAATNGTLVVYLGHGDGTFAPGVPVPSCSAPGEISAADFNGDLIDDLAVACVNDGGWAMQLGDGLGGFAAPVPYAAGSVTRGLDSADLNGDGAPDLVAVSYASSLAWIFINANDGNGTMVGSGPIALQGGSWSTRTGDLDGDGDVDAIVSGQDDGAISILVNDGAGAFALDTAFERGGGQGGIPAIGDVDGDGRQDIIITAFDRSFMAVFLNLGDGTFGPAERHPLDTRGFAAAAGDLDGDGKADVSVTAEFGAGVQIFTTGNGL
jgi:hypothetical protein